MEIMTAEVPTRLFILGRTGRTARALVARAGQITAFTRSPQKLGELRERVTVRQGDPRSVPDLREASPITTLWCPGSACQGWVGRRSSAMAHATPSHPCKPKGVQRLLVISMGARSSAGETRSDCRYRMKFLENHQLKTENENDYKNQ
jgi:hypothetical protein